MPELHLTLGPVRYNPETGSFETLAEIIADGARFAYPVDLPAPMTAAFDYVMRRLRARALDAHRSGRAALRLRHAAPPTCGTSPALAA
ncbi:hypothetical protein [Roseovarius autotrophicus]|uniref:hypothetical protein n=1 Tax=Roseovarius autotrophicus TaxID=2824121 RepID=UPI0019F79439|nr:hypothetical protein [Roseovarius autotrophicus]MBE0452945.1 hypothetical protein [Roseovarius sp.]